MVETGAPELLSKLQKVEKDVATDKRLLNRSPKDSGLAVGKLLAASLESAGKIKDFKPRVTAFLGYLVSHESHYRGQIILSLKQSNYPSSKKD